MPKRLRARRVLQAGRDKNPQGADKARHYSGEKEFGDEGGRHVHFALSVKSGALDALVGRLRSLGIQHDGPIEHDGGDRSAYVEDPEGNVVELWDYFENGSDVNDL